MTAVLRAAGFADLDTYTLYALLRLRVDVFVVEQHSPYPDLDGRDLDDSTVHLWLDRAGTPVGYLRITGQPGDGYRIGRVVVARHARGGGLAGRLVAAALARIADQPCTLDAQTPLVGFYRRYGFVPTGPQFLDAGVPHVPMRRGG